MADETLMNEQQAFEAMRLFLEAYWERCGKTQETRLTDVLSDISAVWDDGLPGDPAVPSDWHNAVKGAARRADT